MSWERYKTTKTGLEVRSLTGGVINPRSYCDDPTIGTIGIYITKGPVCKLKMTPVRQFPNTNIAWDISGSGSATGTIDTFDITWGGTTDIGNLSSQDWSSDPQTGNVQYTTVGTYTATATVTDLLGVTSEPCTVEIEIVDDFPDQRLYIGTTDAGVYYRDPGDSDVTASNTGLTGGDLLLRSLRINPAYSDLPLGQQHLWACNENGVIYTTDGGATWTEISEATLGTPTNTAGDSPAPSASDPDNIDLWFDPTDPDRVYVLRTTSTRTWLYWSDDYGDTWDNEQVVI